ncbi:type II secretion system GspH family protein [Rugamonas sp. A1-17]|nr:type II secretion system GspH family protein [Rugamonas sp. A1-17]
MSVPMARRRRGYTIIEMMVVMVVLGILATAAMPLVELTAKRNKERELKAAVWEIRHAIDAYKQASDSGRIARAAGASGYPPSLPALTAGVPDLTAGGQMLYLLRRVPRDPFAPKSLPAEATWGLRSYASAPDEPKEGADIFDVYSKSEEVGMNGMPYRLW